MLWAGLIIYVISVVLAIIAIKNQNENDRILTGIYILNILGTYFIARTIVREFILSGEGIYAFIISILIQLSLTKLTMLALGKIFAPDDPEKTIVDEP